MQKIKNILQFNGNENFLAILCSDENNELFALYAKVKEITFESNRDYYNCFYGKEYSEKGFIKELASEIILKLNTFKNNDLMAMISVRDIEEYEHICSILENFV